MAPRTVAPATKPRPKTPAAVAAAKKKAASRLVSGENSAVGYSPEVWGPHMWFVFHLVAATYPTAPTAADKTNYMNFYQSLQHVLPCPGCRVGYRTIITSDPTKLSARTFTGRDSLFKWTVDAHNRVNSKLNKPIYNDWQGWYKEYDKLRA